MGMLLAGFGITGGVLGYMTSLKYEYNCEQAGNQLGLEKYIYRGFTTTVGALTAMSAPIVAAIVASEGLSYCLIQLGKIISMLAISTLATCFCLSPLMPIGMTIYLMT